MKSKGLKVFCLSTMFCLVSLSACARAGEVELANFLTYSLDQITSLTISYDEENITFFESENNTLVIKEYMNETKNAYFAKVTQTETSIKISEGGKPLSKKGFERYIEVYLPTNYKQDLTITSTNGEVDFANVTLNLTKLRIDNTSGVVKTGIVNASEAHFSSSKGKLILGVTTASSIRIETTSGSCSCDELNGSVTYTSTSGDLDVKTATGSGSYRANNSGKLNVCYSNVTGNISLFNKNDKIKLVLPQDLQFSFEATTKNGTITTNFGQYLSTTGNTIKGDVGNNPITIVTIETSNGNIDVSIH